MLKGTPRRGNGFWSADAELINGRLAMVGFAAIVLSSFYRGSFWFLHNTGVLLLVLRQLPCCQRMLFVGETATQSCSPADLCCCVMLGFILDF